MTALVIHCSCPDVATAERIARTLVEEHLAACVQVLPGMLSIYSWRGEVQQETEVLLLAKTTRERLDALKARLDELHPYEMPELLALEAVDGLVPYLGWIEQEAQPQ
jgi:periplasmic divalent cation tolerance protein